MRRERERLLFNAKWPIFKQYNHDHDEDKLHFDDMMVIVMSGMY